VRTLFDRVHEHGNGSVEFFGANITLPPEARFASVDSVQRYVDEVNATLNRWETIKRFVVLDRDLSIEEGEMTPSLKVKRKVVEEHYQDQLDALYA